VQQLLVGTALVSVLAWLWWFWDRARWIALLGASLILLGYALVLALEFVAVAKVNRKDHVPAAGAAVLLRAWWREVRIAPQVFCWRQPFRWRTMPDTQCLEPQDGRKHAAVFVHGFVCNRGFWLPWMRVLRDQGAPYTSVNLEPVFGSIEDYIPVVEEAVCRAERLTGLAPVLICHSMGGLAVRAWLAQTPGAAQRVKQVVTIGTPHHGTWLSKFSHVPNGQQMRLNHAWLTALAVVETTARASPYEHFVCWYSNADNIVFPASTAMLPGADNRHVPGMAHVALAFHPKVMRESLAMLSPAARSPAARTVS
jgi:triacylglycerol esterase/lipase EstA (alpha/beta hydrolase family)